MKMPAQLMLPTIFLIWAENSSCWNLPAIFFSEIEVFEALSCCCFGTVKSCTVVVVDNSG